MYTKEEPHMLEISNRTNLLEQKSYKYSLQDVAEPNLQRDIFNYEFVPKVAFNHRRVPDEYARKKSGSPIHPFGMASSR